MYGRTTRFTRLLGVGLLLGSAVGCTDGGERDGPLPGDPQVPAMSTLASLRRAESCDDLLTRIQDDAIAKLKMTVQRAKSQAAMQIERGTTTPGIALDAGATSGGRNAGSPGSASSGVGAVPSSEVSPSAPSFDSDDVAQSGDDGAQAAGPVGASGTNTQVADVDEADFVKVVENGRGIFLLHGNQLHKLKSWPAAETALVGTPVQVEGQPSEMFVTDDGKAVIFSSVGGYGGKYPVTTDAVACSPEGGCGSSPYGGSYGGLKITVVNLSGAAPVVERELYYEGSYVSSRRYEAGGRDVVRAVIQANSKYAGLFEPQVSWYDAWGRPYDEAAIAGQLNEWEVRNTAAIRNTTLADWLPVAEEMKDGQRVQVAPSCGDYFVPVAGLSDYGLTHVVSLDVAQPEQKVGGVTIVGGTSTVYSNAGQLVLAQPDYRWNESIDFGIASGQQTALHLFNLDGATTDYVASGWVPGHLPLRNPQFGIDVAKDGTIRVATTGFVRNEPNASVRVPEFWGRHTENYVVTARPVEGGAIAVVGKTPKLGHEGESVYSARFVGDRGYVVTFRQTDPLIVVDLKTPATPTVLGEIEIPGFSEYMHPLDENHLITVGQGASWGIQLQLFDVSNPASIPQPKVLDLGSGSSSAVSYQHKALTFFEGVLAMPLSGYRSDQRRGYLSTLQLIKVDASAGFTKLGEIDHAPLYADNGFGVQCGVCDAGGCYDYACGYAPEVRRGHFVKGDQGTYVYSFSHAGVLVNDLANLAQPLARVGLPAPQFDGYPYPTSGGPIARPTDGGVAVVVDGGAPVAAQDAGVATMQ